MSVFVDTNVLVYARDMSVPAKQERAHEWMSALWEALRGRTSVQVLNEYYVTVTRKLTPGLALREARADVADLHAWVPVSLSTDLVESAFTAEDRFGLSYWDCLIVAAAVTADCDYLLSEDLQDGQILDTVTVVNPFTHRPETIL
ncbi:MAG: PIN domain-containing protein [Acidimicrobiaceae bacterium]|nr:PIN domain-containing protein [Acidimicrobiaceae bacterium]MCY4176170.1 PIN domain-containing protein [Acidimicrobiaceae bacterium]MCY4281149.1 PIN domain-containing protein [Acidimicrobiaceae bacterium]MCY4294374.1 PIN domain-containing protein [Acidimicrobiaceae bacterium]